MQNDLKLFNSLTRKIEAFTPLKNNQVSMYVCGITPYDITHLGHAFTYVFFDVLVRYLTFKGYKVTYTQNVTDVDDDILKKAREEGKNWKELGEYWTAQYLSDMKALNVTPPTYFVKATDSIPQIIKIIGALLKRGFAYQKNGNVYFEVRKFSKFSQLSRLNRHQMLLISRERGGNPDDPNKIDSLDFVLWQKSAAGEPSWESPFGRGRPGWHIECSAMCMRYLHEQIDIHGGGRDLMYPHHESEIAQSECFTGKKPFVRFWVHTAMILFEGEKMSKSLGNLVLVRDLLKKCSSDAIRWMILSHHYRTPWEFDATEPLLCEENVLQVRGALGVLTQGKNVLKPDLYMRDFIAHMNNDMDTPGALSCSVRLAKRIIREKDRANVSALKQALEMCLSILGFQFASQS